MRRYIIPPEQCSAHINTDVLIVGAGLAGLYAALQLDPALRCILLTKEAVTASNSWLAQGGIAAVIDTKHDDPTLHFEDTVVAGAGLCNEDAVRILVDEGPGDIATLRAMNVPFDLNEDGDLAMTREGGHTRHRVVHAGGDATGRETVRTLVSLVENQPNIEFLQHAFLLDILTASGTVTGATIHVNNQYTRIDAQTVIIATGGIGQIYHNTTNPPVATGDGFAAALRAGAVAGNMEFIQFHPTALYNKTSTRLQRSRALVSEALRGEGAILLDTDGKRFMDGIHPLLELAPRDIVARAIRSAMERTDSPHVWLDISSRGEAFCATRFPTIYESCKRIGLALGKDKVPVAPVQHYSIGGLTTDLFGRTNIEGLYAIGEAADVGVHGANRLASNSMLECLVYARRAAHDIIPSSVLRKSAIRETHQSIDTNDNLPDVTETMHAIRNLCEMDVGIVRAHAKLEQALKKIDAICSAVEKCALTDKSAWECYNMALTAREVFRGAAARKNSAGVHFVQ